MLADFEADEIEVWPENHAAFSLFSKLQTQWIRDMSGPSGLNHLVLFARMDKMNLTQDDYDAMDEDIRIMEIAALNEIRKPA